MAVEKYSLFVIEGGLGKHIAATAVAKCIKNNHPDRKLIIACAWPQVFLNLDFVDKVYRLGATPYFYQTYVEDKDSLLFKHEPYFTTEHIHKKLSLVENWCKLYNLKFDNEKPVLRFNLIEQEKALSFVKENNKPIFLIHTHGGMYQPAEGALPYRWARDMPFNIAQAVADKYSSQYHVVQVTRQESSAIKGATVINQPLDAMTLLSLVGVSSKRLLIDSCLQHAAAALEMPASVLWIATSPKVFGYSIHDNLKAEIPKDFKLPDSFIFDFSFEGLPHECPFDNPDIFDLDDIFASLDGKKTESQKLEAAKLPSINSK